MRKLKDLDDMIKGMIEDATARQEEANASESVLLSGATLHISGGCQIIVLHPTGAVTINSREAARSESGPPDSEVK